MKNKIICLIFIIVMLVSFPFCFSASDCSATVYYPSRAVSGDTIKLGFYLNGVGISGVQGNIVYDSDKVEFVGLTNVLVSVGWTLKTNETDGNINFVSYINDSSVKKLYGSQCIFVADFKVKSVSENDVISEITVDNIIATNMRESIPVDKATAATTLSPVAAESLYLKSLVVTGFDVSPKFDSKTTCYYVMVPYETEYIDIKAEAQSASADVKYDITPLVAGGTNTATVTVSVDGEELIYSVYTYRAENPAPIYTSDTSLSSLAVSYGTLIPDFSDKLTNYSVEVANSVTEIDVVAVPTDSNAFIDISGNTDLQVGENSVIVTVIADDKVTERKILITVNRLSDEKPEVPQEESDWYKWIITDGVWILYTAAAVIVLLLALLISLGYRNRKNKQK